MGRYSFGRLSQLILILGILGFVNGAFSQTNNSELPLIATWKSSYHVKYQGIRDKAFFTGYQGEIFVVGGTPFALNDSWVNCEDLALFSPIIENDNFECVIQTSGWGNKSFAPSIAGLKYRSDDHKKKYTLNKSSLKKNPSLLKFIEEQNQRFSHYRLQISNQNNFALGYSLQLPEQVLFFHNFKNGIEEKSIRISSPFKGNFQDIQFSQNGRFAIVVFSNKTILFEYSNGNILEKCTINKGTMNAPFMGGLAEGSFASISNSGLVTFHFPNKKVYQFDCQGARDSIEILNQTQNSQFISSVSSTGDTLVFVSQMEGSESSFISLYDKKQKVFFGKTIIKSKNPQYVVFSKNGSLIIFHENGYFNYGLPNYKKNTSSKNQIGDSFRSVAFEKYRFDPERNLIYSDAGNILLKEIKSVDRINSYQDILVHTLNGESYLYNLDTRVKVSETYDTMWVSSFSRAVLTKRGDKYGYIYDDYSNRNYFEKLTDFQLTNTLGAKNYNVFYLEYLNGNKRGITDHSLNPIVEFETDSLKLYGSSNNKIIIFRGKDNLFKAYDFESNRTLPYSYLDLKLLVKKDERFLHVTSKEGQGVLSSVYKDEMVPAIYDTIIYPYKSRYYLMCLKGSSMDIYSRIDLQLKLSEKNIDLQKVNYSDSYAFDKITFYKPNEGYFIFGINYNLEDPTTFKAGPYEKILSTENYRNQFPILKENQADPVARVIIDGKEYLLLEDKSTILLSN